ncbi:MAG: hypothetical protein V3R73_02605, partial [Sphingomonadales bacterium]
MRKTNAFGSKAFGRATAVQKTQRRRRRRLRATLRWLFGPAIYLAAVTGKGYQALTAFLGRLKVWTTAILKRAASGINRGIGAVWQALAATLHTIASGLAKAGQKTIVGFRKVSSGLTAMGAGTLNGLKAAGLFITAKTRQLSAGIGQAADGLGRAGKGTGRGLGRSGLALARGLIWLAEAGFAFARGTIRIAAKTVVGILSGLGAGIRLTGSAGRRVALELTAAFRAGGKRFASGLKKGLARSSELGTAFKATVREMAGKSAVRSSAFGESLKEAALRFGRLSRAFGAMLAAMLGVGAKGFAAAFLVWRREFAGLAKSLGQSFLRFSEMLGRLIWDIAALTARTVGLLTMIGLALSRWLLIATAEGL